MNKKLMSFVLAMVLSVGLGSVVLAANYDASSGYQQANAGSFSWTETTSSSTANNQGGTSTSVQTGNGFLIQFGSASDRLSGNLSGIFKYYAGTMVGYMQAGGNYILYDSYGQRGILSNAGGEHFSLQSWNFRTSDLARMPGEGATVEDWNNYLKSIGFSGEQLRRMQFDEQGNPMGTKYTGMVITDDSQVEDSSEEDFGTDTDNYYYYTEGEGDNKKYHKIKKEYCREAKKGEEPDFTDVSIDEDGIEYQSMSLEFFQLLRQTLTQGINFSATLAVGDGATGMTLTVAEDGKARATYCSYDPVNTDSDHSNNSNPESPNPFTGEKMKNVRCMSEVLYNSDGLQIGSKTYTFEFNNTTANDKENQVGVGGTWMASYTFINYDKSGNRYDTTFNKVSISNYDDKDKNIHIKEGDFTWSVDGSTITGNINNYRTREDASKATSVLYYSANGSKYLSVDNERNEKTYFADNQASVVYNSSGTVIKKYQYTDNGVIEAVWASDGTADGDGDKGGTYTVYDYWGRDVATFNDTNGINFGSHASAQGMLSIANKYKKDLISGKITTGSLGTLKSVNWFEEDIKSILASGNRSELINKIFDGKSINTMLNFCNGVAAVATTEVADSTWDGNIPENAVEAEGMETPETKRTSIASSEKAGTRTSSEKGKGYSFTTTIKAGGSAAFQTKCSLVTEKEVTETIYYNSDPAAEGKLWSPDVTDEELEERAKKEGIDTSDEEAMAELKEKMKQEKIKAKAEELGIDLENVSEEELAARAEKEGIDTSDEEAMAELKEKILNERKEDLENGFFTKDGKTYAILEASSINMMTGSGFEPAEGETILVEVSESKKDEIVDKVKSSGDRSIMFMGDVRESIKTGGKEYLVMAMNEDYGGGYVQGEEDVESAKEKITETSMEVANNPDAYRDDVSAVRDGKMTEEEWNKKYPDIPYWVADNTLANIDKLGVGGSKVKDEQGNELSGIEKIRRAWQMLYEF